MKLQINGKEISGQTLQDAISHYRHQHPELTPEAASKEATEEVIRHFLLQDAARQSCPDVPAEIVEQEFARFRATFADDAAFARFSRENHTSKTAICSEIGDSMRIRFFISRLTENLPEPGEDELRRRFEADPAAAAIPPAVTGAHIVRKTTPENWPEVFAELCEVRRQLLDGADFSATAARCSDCSEESGALGTFEPGQMVTEFDAVLFSMRPGEISPVFQTRYGLHIATVTARREGYVPSFDEALPQLRAMRLEEMRQEAVEAFLKQAGSKAVVYIQQ